MERKEILRGYYENYDEDGRLGTRRGCVEFLTTVHYVEKYLRPGDRIIEIGAGTGRYSHYFARQGYSVDAVELVEHNIDVFRKNTVPGESVTVRHGDAVDLCDIPSDSYDVTLLLGPMYHLYTDADRRAALSEAIRVTKPSGVVFAAYCNNDMCVFQFVFGRDGVWDERFKSLVDPVTFKCASTPEEIFVLYRREEIDRLMENLSVTRLHYVGTDMLTRFIGDAVDRMDDETFDTYMRYILTICERDDMAGATNHVLDVFRKE